MLMHYSTGNLMACIAAAIGHQGAWQRAEPPQRCILTLLTAYTAENDGSQLHHGNGCRLKNNPMQPNAEGKHPAHPLWQLTQEA